MPNCVPRGIVHLPSVINFSVICVCAHSVVSDSSWPHGLYPTRLLCSWNFPSKNTAVGCHFLRSQPRDQTHISCVSYTGRQFLYQLSHQGIPVSFFFVNSNQISCPVRIDIVENESHSVVSDSLRPHGLTMQSMEFSRPELLEGVAFPFSRGSSQPKAWTQVSHIAGRFLPAEPQGKPKNTGVGSLCLLQGIFVTQVSNWGLLHCRQILYQLSYQGRPWI